MSYDYLDTGNDEEYRAMQENIPKNKLPLEHQDKCIAELNRTIGELNNRLKFVLTPDTTAKEAELATDSVPDISPLAQHLVANTEEIYRATTKLRQLMERLEI